MTEMTEIAKVPKAKKKKDSKFNILASNRRSKYCMGPIVADEDHVFVASDVGSAEPNIMLNLSDDPTLKAVLYEMKGQRPVWDKRGVLLSDSLYITVMSSGPLLGPVLERLGEPWLDAYAKNSDEGKDALGATYKVCKQVVLAALYGMGASRLSREMADIGLSLNPKQCKEILDGLWASIGQLAEVRNIFAYEFRQAYKKKQPYVTPFGFILPTEKSSDALNYVVQSSVSAWVRTLNSKLFSRDVAELVCVIHDEIIVQVENGRLEEYRDWLLLCVKETNEVFQLQYPMQLGWKVADNFYGVKG